MAPYRSKEANAMTLWLPTCQKKPVLLECNVTLAPYMASIAAYP
jgi:hypothetical protein